MKDFSNGGKFVESVNELPRLKGSRLFLDLETTSGDPKIKSVDPWRNCSIAGICVKNEGSPAFYIPVKCNDPYQKYALPRESVVQWAKDTCDNHDVWINHNVKYDMHVLYNDFKIDWDKPVICTLNAQAKLYDTDRMYKGGYSLDVLSKQLLGRDIDKFGEALQVYTEHSQDYGDIHPHVLGEYGCEDVLTNEKLYEFFNREMPVDLSRVFRTECELTRVLVYNERLGIRIQPVDIEKELKVTEAKLAAIQFKLYEMFDKWLNPSSPKAMHDMVVNYFGMPVIAWNVDEDTGEQTPSFSKDALKDYLHLDAPQAFYDFIRLALGYRKYKIYHGLFLETYKDKHINGYIHPNFNQNVRTGRLSCSEPNMMQLSEMAKELVLPWKEGESLLCYDYSQIEYRTIVHYIQDSRAIRALNDNPNTDFHTHVGNQLGTAMGLPCINRKAAKQLNFQNAYGGGVEKQLKALSKLSEFTKFIEESLTSRPEYSEMSSEQRRNLLRAETELLAKRTYETYHREVPSLKRTSKDVEKVCKRRGYVFNIFGRRRHIPADKAYIAFNALNQSAAADLMKDRMVALWKMLRKTDIKMLIQVHDELVFSGPTELIDDYRTQRDICKVLEDCPVPLSVPIRAEGKKSSVSWADASNQTLSIPYEEKFGGFSHVEGASVV